MVVGDLAEQPVDVALLAARLEPDHQPLALHSLAMKEEVEVTFGQSLARVLAGYALPGPAIP